MGQIGDTAGYIIFFFLSIGFGIGSMISIVAILENGQLGLIGIHLSVFILTGTFVFLTVYFFKKIRKHRKITNDK